MFFIFVLSLIHHKALLQQAKVFLESFHTHKVATITQLLENESWVPAKPIIHEFKVIMCSLLDPNKNLRKSISRAFQWITKSANDKDVKEEDKEQEEEEDVDVIEYHGKKYSIVNSILMFSKLLCDYIFLQRKLPLLTVEIIQRVIEIFQLFNTRTHVLVLKQGARQVGSLEKINVKHLGTPFF